MNLLGAEGGFDRWYGLIIGLGMVVCIIAAWFLVKKRGYNADIVFNIAIVCIPFAILGARIYFIIFNIAGGEGSFDGWFLTDEGRFTLKYFIGFSRSGKYEGLAGLALYGGLIAAALAAPIVRAFNKRDKNIRNHMTYIQMLDAFFILIILGQIIGRWGNFANREAYGNYIGQDSWFPYGVYIEKPLNFGEVPGWYQATFFYESFLNLIGFCFMLWMWLGKRKSYDGFIFSFYCLWYGAVRLFVEGLRSDSLYTGGMSVFIGISLLLTAIGIMAACIALKAVKAKKQGTVFKVKELYTYAGLFLFAACCVILGTVMFISGNLMRISQLVSIVLIAWGASSIAGHIIKAKQSGKRIFIFSPEKELSLEYLDFEKSINYICQVYDKNGKLMLDSDAGDGAATATADDSAEFGQTKEEQTEKFSYTKAMLSDKKDSD